MPRQKNAIPSYLLHKKSGQARVRIDGHDHLLGPFGSEESRIKYGKLISQSVGGLSVDPLANRGTVPRNEVEADSGLSVAELLLAFKRHADAYYTKNGKPTAEINCLDSAMRPVRELFAFTPAREFSPLMLKAVQKKYVARVVKILGRGGKVCRDLPWKYWPGENLGCGLRCFRRRTRRRGQRQPRFVFPARRKFHTHRGFRHG